MDGLWFLLLVTICFIATASIIFKKHPKRRLPPGPKPWPIIGNLNLIGSIPHQSLHLLSQKYGGIMHLKFGQRSVVVASTPDMAKEFLKTHDAVFASRPPLSAGKYTSYNYSDLVWAPYGPHFRQARKIYLLEMFSPKKLESRVFEQIGMEEKCNFIARLHSLSGKPVSLRDHLFHYNFSTLHRMALGRKYFTEPGGETEEGVVSLEEFEGLLDEWFFLSGVFNIGDWIPWLHFLDVQGYVKRMKALNKKVDRIYEYVIHDHLNKRGDAETDDGDDSKDLVDKLLQLSEDSSLEVKLTRDCVKALIQNLIIGGADTAPTTIEWIIHELMKHPSIYKKAKEELQKEIERNRWVEEDDFSRLPYIEAIIMEAMRLHPIGTFLAPHYAIEDCQVAGYDIPKGTTVLINTWSIGRDPNTWDAPVEFLPERFVGKVTDITGGNFGLLPFGSGRRRCPGYNLGLKTVRAIVANLLHGFNLKLVDGMNPEDVSLEEKYRLSTHPKQDLELILEPTLPAYLYSRI